MEQAIQPTEGNIIMFISGSGYRHGANGHHVWNLEKGEGIFGSNQLKYFKGGPLSVMAFITVTSCITQ